MKQVFRLFFIVGMALPSIAFGMNLANDQKFTRRRAAIALEEDGVDSENTSPTDSPRNQDAENLNQANVTAQAEALNNASLANNGIMSVADRFAAKVERSTEKISRINLQEKNVAQNTSKNDNDAVEEDEWADVNTHSPTPPPFPNHINQNNMHLGLTDQIESPIPEKPESPDATFQIPKEYKNRPALIAPATRAVPLPPTIPTIKNREIEEPTIEEIPEPTDEDFIAKQEEIRSKLSPQQREETDFTQVREVETRGVVEERNRTLPQNPQKPAQRNVRFADQARVKPFNPRNPADRVHDNDSIVQRAKHGTQSTPLTGQKDRLGIPMPAVKTNENRPSLKASNTGNLFIFAGLFGLFSWIDYKLAQDNSKSFKVMIAKDFVSGIQQAAAANIAQQLLCKKTANTLAFTATFALLHAGEVGLKKLTASVLSKTKTGKKLQASYNKLSKKKRNIIDGFGTLASWTIKTILAHAIAK